MLTKEQIGALIKVFRLKARMSQVELGKYLGRSHAAISDIERGKTELTLRDLTIIAESLDTPITEFLGIQSGPSHYQTTIQFQGNIVGQIKIPGYNINLMTDIEIINNNQNNSSLENPTNKPAIQIPQNAK